jgi:DNA-3-methyladenine glycosylase I
MADFVIRRVTPEDRDAIRQLWEDRWGGDLMVMRGEVVRAAGLPGFIAEQDGKLAGLLTYRSVGDGCEVVSLDSLAPGQGIGQALMAAVIRQAREESCCRVYLVTTNDNTRALRFYQKLGFCLTALRRGAVDEARSIKPSIPLLGEDGIPIRDELELERLLS